MSPTTRLDASTATSRAPQVTPWLALVSRLFLFASLQASAAALFAALGSTQAWADSATWWPLYITIANVLGAVWLTQVFRAEGLRYADMFRLDRAHIGRDLLTLLGILAIAAPLSMLPNPLLATALFGDSQAIVPLLFRPAPPWAMVPALVAFGITQGLVELPTYFIYATPRIERLGVPTWAAVAAGTLMLSLQHIAAPLWFDGRYLIWRGLMFLPFALFAGIILRWRPRLLPYLAIMHALMDLSLIAVYLMAVAA